ncbi:MAG: DNA polymerase III subunit gamma/tau, partial [Bacteroidales bacterium]|nr:DNA polymerase III subunit gamma/tau [Bacteroidales bacterium]
IISGIASHFRDLLVCKDPATAHLFQVGATIRERYVETAKRCDHLLLYEAIEIANSCDLNYRISKNKRLLLELTLIRLCQLSGEPTRPSKEKKSELKPIVPSEEAASPKDSTPAPATKETSAEDTPNQTGKTASATGTPTQTTREVPTTGTPVQTGKEAPATGTPSSPKKKDLSQTKMGVSIASLTNKKADEETEPQTEASPNTGNGSNLFTEEQLIAAWTEYADQLIEEKLLKNTMSLYLPKMKSETLFEVEVNTELNKQYITDNSNAILAHLREKLKNDDISMTLTIAKVNAIKKPVTSHEIFEEMVNQNPSLQKLSDEFGLELI